MARKRKRRKAHTESGSAFGSIDHLLDARPVAMLDLHGFTASEAEVAVKNFITSWQRRASGKVVHIITGRGKRSAGSPVLGSVVRRLLETEFSALARNSCPDADRGGYLVLLR